MEETSRCREYSVRAQLEGEFNCRLKKVIEENAEKENVYKEEIERLKKEKLREAQTSFTTMKEKKKLENKIVELERIIQLTVPQNLQGELIDRDKEDLYKEIASLSSVLEIKNNELKAISEEKEISEGKLKDYEEVKYQVGTLTGEVDNLKHQVEKKKQLERNMAMEMEELRHSLRMESSEKRRLSVERELLVWKVKEGTPPARVVQKDDVGTPIAVNGRSGPACGGCCLWSASPQRMNLQHKKLLRRSATDYGFSMK